MTFADVPANTAIFLDANVFVYNFGPDPLLGPPSRSLLKRIELGELQGYVSTHELSNVAHRLMTLEACQIYGWPYAGIAQRLRNHPAEIAQLHGFRNALNTIDAIGIHILPVHGQSILSACDLSLQYGLLSGDALVVAMMQTNGLTHLASNDADFDRVPGIIRFGPV
jgi:predicted nucleic acid-binding protein